MEMMLALAAVPLSVARKYVKKWNKNGIGVQAVRRTMPKGQNKKGYRLYIPIKPRKTAKAKVPHDIIQALQQMGYRVEDYISGIAVDASGKRQMKIGKLLKDEQLRQQFANDPQRAAHRDEYTCVISAHPYDVIGMSTGRRWDQTSCMRLDLPGKSKGGVYQSKVADDVAEGTLVAYAISPRDTNINKPHARLLIKPFYKEVAGKLDKNQLNFRVETQVYGTPIPGFRETVSAWLRKVNKGAAAGFYKLARDLYDDGVGAFALVGTDISKMDEKQQYAFIEQHHSHLQTLIASDPKWLGVLLKNAGKFYSTDAQHVGSSVMSLLEHLDSEIPTQTIARQFEQNMPEEYMEGFVKFLPGSSWRRIIKYSPRLKAMTDQLYAYDPDAPDMPADQILNQRAYWDSRWLSKLNEIPDQHGAGNTFLNFVRERFKYTPEFRNSTAPGSVALFKYLGLMFRIASQSDNNDYNGVKVARKLARRFPADTYFDPLMARMMGRIWKHRILRANGRLVGETPEGLLCAVDHTWPSQDPDLITDAGMTIFKKKVFESLVKYATADMVEALASNIRSQMRRIMPTVWKLDYPWTVPFIEKLARGPYSPTNVGWAKQWLHDVKEMEDEADKLLAELGDIDWQPA